MSDTADDMHFTIRRAEPGDYEAVTRIFEGPGVVWGTLQVPYPSRDFWRRRLAEPAEGYYGLLTCAGDEIVGELGLLTFPNAPRRRHAGKLFMAVRDDWQGRGAGSALMQAALDLADRWLNLSRLELEVWTDNQAAVALYRKCGFVIEGTLRSFGYRDGQYVDAYAMGRLKDG
jgi:putative acetyltransferase